MLFARARNLLEQYYCAVLTKGLSNRAESLLHEIRSRLRMIQWLYDRTLKLDERLVAEARSRTTGSASAADVFIVVFTDASVPDCTSYRQATIPFADSDELRVDLEAFYYSAHRIRDILRDAKEEFPCMGSFESVGIRDVRNHLVEHPTGRSGNVFASFSAGGPDGPKLKRVRHAGDPAGTEDSGLHANAREFIEALEATLTRAIERTSCLNQTH